VALDKPEAAKHLATRIVAVVETLRLHPHLGRAGAEPGIRELVIGGTAYSNLIEYAGRRVIISTIWVSERCIPCLRLRAGGVGA
jgi:plasmid stabilization system protein ParE